MTGQEELKNICDLQNKSYPHMPLTHSAMGKIKVNLRVTPVNSPHQGQWRRASMFSLICVWINSWVNNRDAGDLRRYRAHYDITVMTAIEIVLGGCHRST